MRKERQRANISMAFVHYLERHFPSFVFASENTPKASDLNGIKIRLDACNKYRFGHNIGRYQLEHQLPSLPVCIFI